MDEFVRCDWQTVTPEILAQYPDLVRYHREHHAGNMEQCDAIVCVCGNTPDGDGFESTKEDRYRCETCGRIIDRRTGRVIARGPDARQIQQVVKDAQEAFWGAVAAGFPEVTTGDFPPDATFRFEDACRDTIKTWLEINHPAFQ